MSDDAPKLPDDQATVRGLAAGRRVFGRYVVEAVVGRGGMGVVWRANDETLGEIVALKFLPEVVARDEVAVDELKAETRRTRRLAHPHIVRVHDFLQDAEHAAVSMEFVEGATLGQLRLTQPGKVFSPEALAPLVAQLCAALDYAHFAAKVVHRDLKPANILVTTQGVAKVSDFGIARSLTETQTRLTGGLSGTSGTLLYMSPQQLLGRKAAPADDIYSLGSMLCELLTGKPPFYTGDITHQVLQEKPPGLAAQREALGVVGGPIPPQWEETILACLAKEPEQRPKSAGEVAVRLGLASPEVLPAAAVPAPRPVADDVRVTAPATAKSLPPSPRKKISRTLLAAIALILLAGGGLGYYLGVYAPAQQRQAEIARQEEATRTASLAHRQEEQAKETQRADREQMAYVEMGAKIDAFVDGALPSLRDDTQAAVKAYLATAPANYAAEVQNHWARRLAGWQASRYAAARGGVIVRTEPTGAEVTVGALEHGNSPLTVKDVKLGKYPVKVRAAGYQDWAGEVVVKENEFAELNVPLVRIPGAAAVAAPPGPETENPPVRPGGGPLKQRLEAKEQRLEAASQNGLLAPAFGRTWTLPGLALEMRYIAPGAFAMGSPEFEEGHLAEESPRTRIILTQGYWLGKTEVTQREWMAVMKDNPSRFRGNELPVEMVSWDDAMEFCRKLTERERAADRLPAGYVYSLPTEAQWEYACRAGTTTAFAGDVNAMAWLEQGSGSKTHPVAQKAANAWGLYDMHGNVWEWCSSWYGKYPGGTVRDYAGPVNGLNRIYRGGSAFFPSQRSRSAARIADPADTHFPGLGFRLALRAVK